LIKQSKRIIAIYIRKELLQEYKLDIYEANPNQILQYAKQKYMAENTGDF